MRRRRLFSAFLLLFGVFGLSVAYNDEDEEIQSDFRFISYGDLMRDISVFYHEDILGFVQLSVDEERSQLLLGARDSLFRLSLDDLEVDEMARWESPKGTTKKCTMKGQSKADCHNFIKVMVLHGDKVFVCGTNAFKPQCSWRNARNLNKVEEGKITAEGICPFSPYHNSTALITDEGVLYTATVVDINARDPAIYRSPIGSTKPLRTEQYNSRWLNEPNFISSYEINDFVYFFFREAAVEYINCGKRIYSRVARVCKSDKGGRILMENIWTTFLKARLNCSIPGEYPFHFDEIQHTFYSEESQLLYAIFTTPPNSMAGSAVCVYNMSAFDAAFSGSFKYSESSQTAWLRRDNPAPQNTCPSPAQGNKRSSLDEQTEKMIHRAQQYQLMDPSVQPVGLYPELMGENERWTHLVVDHVQGKHHKSYNILFVATDTGRIKKMVHLEGHKEACLLEEIKVVPNGEPKPVKALKFSKGEGALYVGTTGKVVKIPVERCSRFTDSDVCTNARDPYCGWNTITHTCTTAPGGKPGVHYWHQNIVSCPQLKHPVDGDWSDFSKWTPCFQIGDDAVGDRCHCRYRQCNNPAPYYGGKECRGPSVEITNCTVHGKWTSWSEWSSCSVSCGTAIRTRRRQCGNPPPKHGGRACLGRDRDEEYCPGNPRCPTPPVNGNWSSWTPWSKCTSRCNQGIQTRRRQCDNPKPGINGVPCIGNKQEWKMCNPQSCPEIRKTTPYSPWMKTNQTKGGYFEQRFKFTCRANVPSSKLIKTSHEKSQVRFCFDDGRGCKKAGELRKSLDSFSIDTFSPVDRVLKKYCRYRRRKFKKYCKCRTLGIFLVCQRCGYG